MQNNKIYTNLQYLLFCFLLLSQPLQAAQITLQSGEVLILEIIDSNEQTIIAKHQLLGHLEIPLDQITLINHTEANVLIAKTSEKDQAPEEKNTAWENSIAAGISLQTGNTDNQSFNFSVNRARTREFDKIAIDMRYLFGQENGDRNTQKFTTGILHDWFFDNSRWTVFTDPRFDYDEFNDWEYRLSAHIGPGYKIWESNDLSAFLRLGIGALKEFNSSRSGIIPELLFGGEVDWQISKLQKLSANTTFYPELETIGELRNVTGITWSYSFADTSNLALNLGLYNEYQSNVSSDVKKNDLRLLGGISYAF